MTKKREFTKEHLKNLSIAHRGQISWRKGKVFVDKDEQRKRRLAYRKKWREKNKERILEQEREWRKKNRDKINKHARLRYHNNSDAELDRIRYKKYGISGNKFKIMSKKQNNKCVICDGIGKKNLSVDHDHVTGKIRGLICNNCNVAIGRAKDSPTILRAMADYLERNT